MTAVSDLVAEWCDRLQHSDDATVAARVLGDVSSSNFREVLFPLVNAAVATHRRSRVRRIEQTTEFPSAGHEGHGIHVSVASAGTPSDPGHQSADPHCSHAGAGPSASTSHDTADPHTSGAGAGIPGRGPRGTGRTVNITGGLFHANPKIRRLLQEEVNVDGVMIRWGQLTADQHRRRINKLNKQIQGTEKTVDKHRDALELLEANGAKCLDDLYQEGPQQ